jgi:aminopeptidase N
MGGMENWGAIFYNDTTLLVDPASASQANRERVFSVIAHEIAHQWFGDLVTMAWWDNLWLNEGFASWMGTKATDHFNPSWKIELRSKSEVDGAMGRDARRTSHPIQQKVESEGEANEAFDEITYQKGMALLRMLEAYLGEEKFRAGIRAYMAVHKMSNTTTADLWSALEKASGHEVRALAANWTEQPGFPLVRVTSGEGDGLRLAQERFAVNYPDAPPLTWRVPIQYAFSGEKNLSKAAMLEPGPLSVAAGRGAPIVNLGGIGYYRTVYDEPTFTAVQAALPDLAEADRLTLLNDTFASVKGKQVPLTRFLSLAERIAPEETSVAIWDSLLDKLQRLDRLFRAAPGLEEYRAWARRIAGYEMGRLSLYEAPDESELIRGLRGQLMETLGKWGDPAATKRALEIVAEYEQHSKSVPADLRRAAFFLAGRAADEAGYERLHAFARKELSTQIKTDIYRGLAASLNQALAAKTLAISLTDERPPQEATRLIGHVANDGEQVELAWDFARAHQPELSAKLDTFSGNRFFPEIAEHFAEAARADELEIFAKEKLPADAKIAVAKAADDIRFNAELKARVLPAIAAWLQPH